MDKRKRCEGENMLGDHLQDNISARAETRGFSEQQAGSQDTGRLSNATIPPVGTYPAGLLPPLQDACARLRPNRGFWPGASNSSHAGQTRAMR